MLIKSILNSLLLTTFCALPAQLYAYTEFNIFNYTVYTVHITAISNNHTEEPFDWNIPPRQAETIEIKNAYPIRIISFTIDGIEKSFFITRAPSHMFTVKQFLRTISIFYNENLVALFET